MAPHLWIINEKFKTIYDSKGLLVNTDKIKNIFQIPVEKYKKSLSGKYHYRL